MQVLMKSDLKVTLESGRFPRACASIRKWIARRAFIRTVHMIVHVRRAQVDYHKMTKEVFKAERARLLRIARTMSGPPVDRAQASTSDESLKWVSVKEINRAQARLTQGVRDDKQISFILGDGSNAVIDDGDDSPPRAHAGKTDTDEGSLFEHVHKEGSFLPPLQVRSSNSNHAQHLPDALEIRLSRLEADVKVIHHMRLHRYVVRVFSRIHILHCLYSCSRRFGQTYEMN